MGLHYGSTDHWRAETTIEIAGRAHAVSPGSEVDFWRMSTRSQKQASVLLQSISASYPISSATSDLGHEPTFANALLDVCLAPLTEVGCSKRLRLSFAHSVIGFLDETSRSLSRNGGSHPVVKAGACTAEGDAGDRGAGSWSTGQRGVLSPVPQRHAQTRLYRRPDRALRIPFRPRTSRPVARTCRRAGEA